MLIVTYGILSDVIVVPLWAATHELRIIPDFEQYLRVDPGAGEIMLSEYTTMDHLGLPKREQKGLDSNASGP